MSDATHSGKEGSRWTAGEDLLLRNMALNGSDHHAIARAIGRSPYAIVRRAHGLGIEIVGKTPQAGNKNATIIRYQRAVDVMAANILHLVDLKRAGHSPRFTELNITPDVSAPGQRVTPLAEHSSSSCAISW